MLQGRDSGEAPPTSVLKVTTKNQKNKQNEVDRVVSTLSSSMFTSHETDLPPANVRIFQMTLFWPGLYLALPDLQLTDTLAAWVGIGMVTCTAVAECFLSKSPFKLTVRFMLLSPFICSIGETVNGRSTSAVVRYLENAMASDNAMQRTDVSINGTVVVDYDLESCISKTKQIQIQEQKRSWTEEGGAEFARRT